MSAAASHRRQTDESLHGFLLAATTPILIGTFVSILLYALLPHMPVPQELAARYLAQSPIQKVIVWLGCVGLASVATRAFRLPRSFQALGMAPPSSLAGSRAEDASTLEAVLVELDGAAPALRRTPMFRRIADVVGWIAARKSSQGIEERLRHQAESALARQHDATAGVRVATWGMMLLGFVGTIGALAAAVSQIPSEELTSALALLTGGLGSAFDATVLSMVLSMILVFASFAVERFELQMLARVESETSRILLPLFSSSEPAGALPYQGVTEAETRAADHVLKRTELLIQRQAQLWEDTLERTRERWATTLDAQTEALNDALRNGMGTSLTSHSEQLALTREDFLKLFERASTRLLEGISRTLERQSSLHSDIVSNFDDMVRKASDSLGAIQKDERQQIDALMRTMNERVTKWHQELKEGNEATREVSIELRRQAETLLQIVSQEEELSRLQGRLTENLEALRASSEFDEAVHSLSAAVHLLTARAKSKAA